VPPEGSDVPPEGSDVPPEGSDVPPEHMTPTWVRTCPRHRPKPTDAYLGAHVPSAQAQADRRLPGCARALGTGPSRQGAQRRRGTCAEAPQLVTERPLLLRRRQTWKLGGRMRGQCVMWASVRCADCMVWEAGLWGDQYDASVRRVRITVRACAAVGASSGVTFTHWTLRRFPGLSALVARSRVSSRGVWHPSSSLVW